MIMTKHFLILMLIQLQSLTLIDECIDKKLFSKAVSNTC